MSISIDHVALSVNDAETMLAFYHDVLGLALERAEEFRRGEAPFASVRVNADSIIDFFPRALWEGGGAGPAGSAGPAGPAGPAGSAGNGPRPPQPGMNHVCLAYPPGEWAALVARLADRGVHVDKGPVPRWGAHGGGVSVYFHDPEGNYLEARHYPDAADSSQGS